MTSYQRKYEHLASIYNLSSAKCFGPRGTRASPRSSPPVAGDGDQSKNLRSSSARRSSRRGHRLAEGTPSLGFRCYKPPVNQWRGNRHLGADSGSAGLC